MVLVLGGGLLIGGRDYLSIWDEAFHTGTQPPTVATSPLMIISVL